MNMISKGKVRGDGSNLSNIITIVGDGKPWWITTRKSIIFVRYEQNQDNTRGRDIKWRGKKVLHHLPLLGETHQLSLLLGHQYWDVPVSSQW